MDWTNLMEVVFQLGTLLGLGIILFGGWLFFKAPTAEKHENLLANRPKTLGWRE